MQQTAENSNKSRRQIKRVLIVCAVVELVVTVVAMIYATQK